jgi:DNA gyrase/topoisomerase IV subunit B
MVVKESFRKLDDYGHARIRTEMYLGSREERTQFVPHYDGNRLVLNEYTWVPALYTAFREIVDNSLDEIVSHGYGNTLRVDYNPDNMEFLISDNGRGIPIEEKKSLGKGPAASILLGEARAGRNFDDRADVAGVNGLGAAIVNFTSSSFDIMVHRDGKRFYQLWTEGRYGGKDIHKTEGPVIEDASKDEIKANQGTSIQFIPSSKVYSKLTLPLELIKDRMWDIAVANPKVNVFFNDEHLVPNDPKKPVEDTYFPNVLAGVVEMKSADFNASFYIVPNFSDQEVVYGTVNNLPVFDGGSHIEAFRNLFYPAVMKILQPRLKKEKLTMRKEDISTGLLIYSVTRMSNPQFDSQTKVRLVSEVKPIIKTLFLESSVSALLRRNPDWVESILDKCRSRSTAKDRRDINKAQKAMKRQQVAGLRDATAKVRDQCVLFLGEGESAIGKMVEVRDPAIHGGLGLRGKILNTYGIQPKKVLDSEALKSIMNSIGLEIGEKAVRGKLRYNKIFIATDEDEDGKNITALLVNFFYTFWPELFTDKNKPFIFKFYTPFIIAKKNKTRKYIYADKYDEFKTDLATGQYKGWKITRAKGVGRLDRDDWSHSIKKPKLTPIIDDGDLKSTLDLIFNPMRADDRKGWLADAN